MFIVILNFIMNNILFEKWEFIFLKIFVDNGGLKLFECEEVVFCI